MSPLIQLRWLYSEGRAEELRRGTLICESAPSKKIALTPVSSRAQCFRIIIACEIRHGNVYSMLPGQGTDFQALRHHQPPYHQEGRVEKLGV